MRIIHFRITKYPLLIEPLIKTAKERPEEQQKLKNCLHLVKSILVDVNGQVRSNISWLMCGVLSCRSKMGLAILNYLMGHYKLKMIILNRNFGLKLASIICCHGVLARTIPGTIIPNMMMPCWHHPPCPHTWHPSSSDNIKSQCQHWLCFVSIFNVNVCLCSIFHLPHFTVWLMCSHNRIINIFLNWNTFYRWQRRRGARDC